LRPCPRPRQFLSKFNILETEEGEKALRSVFVSRPEVFQSIDFAPEYWTSLTPEKALLARVFADHCRETKDDEALEQCLPVVTAHALFIQDYYNRLLETLERLDAEGVDESVADRLEEQVVQLAFVIKELLKMAVELDYADEMGRRKMWTLIRAYLLSEVSRPRQT
jgi:condensin complex subunit 3